ncbi:ATP-dependent DNA helicase pfh1-like [Chenopodium quinoa]|uniref:ATP-dependent DNA helicase pfh1-like n=1 Tax=Chenopodium quinoa TaxID=63459 RepID=UPI000B77F5CF|nr:ATP-dependent DNA helicase pfh1-like [Chenopodium quinoa]
MGKSLAHFHLDHLHEELPEELNRTKDIIDALDAPIPQECIDCRGKLNSAQQIAFDRIISQVQSGKPGCFFVDGPGGTGKTFLYNTLYAEVRMSGKIVLPTSTSGIAAANIPSGRTAHSRFKIPLDSETSLACDVPKQGSLAALIRETTLIIWDEASMAKKENIESVELLLLFGGDFRQVLPVVPRKTQREAVAASLVNSHIWPWLEKLHLTENIRAREDPPYASFLLSLGNGQLQSNGNAYVQVPPHIVSYYHESDDPINHLAATAFPELEHAVFSPDIFTERAILTPLNDAVDAIITVLIDKFPGNSVIYKSFDSMLDDNCSIYPTEFLNQLAPGGMTPHELVLKINSPVILLRNIDPADGLCNGTRLICKSFRRNVIVCSIAIGHRRGELVFIHRVNLRPPSSTKYPIQFERIQFPLTQLCNDCKQISRPDTKPSDSLLPTTMLFPWTAICCLVKGKEVLLLLYIYNVVEPKVKLSKFFCIAAKHHSFYYPQYKFQHLLFPHTSY